LPLAELSFETISRGKQNTEGRSAAKPQPQGRFGHQRHSGSDRRAAYPEIVRPNQPTFPLQRSNRSIKNVVSKLSSICQSEPDPEVDWPPALRIGQEARLTT
jgi:hypothetical protein